MVMMMVIRFFASRFKRGERHVLSQRDTLSSRQESAGDRQATKLGRGVPGARELEYRIPFLLEALEARDFFSDPNDRCEAIELFDGLCDLCDVRSYAGLASVLDRFRHYRHARDPSAIRDR